MDIIIVCHTEFGFVHSNKQIVFDKKNNRGVKEGVLNLVKIAEKYGAKITFAVCPEVVDCFPKGIKHEIGLHIHPGYKEYARNGFNFFIGDSYLKEHCKQSVNSSILKDYSFEEQLDMITTGKNYLNKVFGYNLKSFVAGRWSLNNDTIKALTEAGFTHDCSVPPHSKSDRYDYSKLPRICMPYHPAVNDYQKKGSLPILITPISKYFPNGGVSPEAINSVGVGWLKACFLEYYKQNAPLFHICLHSPSMEDNYFALAMDDFFSFILKHKNINFRFVSEIKEYPENNFKTNLLPYIFRVNKNILKTYLLRIIK